MFEGGLVGKKNFSELQNTDEELANHARVQEYVPKDKAPSQSSM